MKNWIYQTSKLVSIAFGTAIMSTSALALTIETPIHPGIDSLPVFQTDITETLALPPTIPSDATIGVARLDGGRLIPTPYVEQQDWTFLNRRVSAKIQDIGSGNYIKYIPEIPFDGQDTDNKIDEIRLTAAGEGMDYVIIYGVGPDARWASLGNKALVETGLSVPDDCVAWEAAKAKALLVESHSGQVLGAVTAENIEFHIGELADRVGELITSLSGPSGV